MAHIALKLCMSALRSESDARNWLEQIALLLSKHHILLYSICLYSNPYSNASELQRITTHDGQ
jgi:hypothetical protein